MTTYQPSMNDNSTASRASTANFQKWFDKNRNFVYGGGAIVLILLLLAFLIPWPKPQYQSLRIATVDYTVRAHDTIFSIAQEHSIQPIDLAMMNDATNRSQFPMVCKTGAEQISLWPLPLKRTGDFCNPSLRLYWQSTIVPRAHLTIPAYSVTTNPATALVSKMGMGNIALLVDGSKSQNFQHNLDAAVAIHMAMSQQGKHLVAIWVYTHDEMFKYVDGSKPQPLGGKYAGLIGALNVLKVEPATKAGEPGLDQIALITSDAGATWDLNLIGDSKPVFGLCTSKSCFDSNIMGKLTKSTGGQRG